jgi:hypothetical protein
VKEKEKYVPEEEFESTYQDRYRGRYKRGCLRIRDTVIEEVREEGTEVKSRRIKNGPEREILSDLKMDSEVALVGVEVDKFC